MNEFLNQFENYCQTPGIDSGKARSYSKAIQYLFDFMNITTINKDAIIQLHKIENDLSDPNSLFYNELLKFLETRRQSSYLKKGFIKAALKYFFEFV